MVVLAFLESLSDPKDNGSHENINKEPRSSDHEANPNASILDGPTSREDVTKRLRGQCLWLEVAEGSYPVGHGLQWPNDTWARERGG